MKFVDVFRSVTKYITPARKRPREDDLPANTPLPEESPLHKPRLGAAVPHPTAGRLEPQRQPLTHSTAAEVWPGQQQQPAQVVALTQQDHLVSATHVANFMRRHKPADPQLGSNGPMAPSTSTNHADHAASNQQTSTMQAAASQPLAQMSAPGLPPMASTGQMAAPAPRPTGVPPSTYAAGSSQPIHVAKQLNGLSLASNTPLASKGRLNMLGGSPAPVAGPATLFGTPSGLRGASSNAYAPGGAVQASRPAGVPAGRPQLLPPTWHAPINSQAMPHPVGFNQVYGNLNNDYMMSRNMSAFDHDWMRQIQTAEQLRDALRQRYAYGPRQQLQPPTRVDGGMIDDDDPNLKEASSALSAVLAKGRNRRTRSSGSGAASGVPPAPDAAAISAAAASAARASAADQGALLADASAGAVRKVAATHAQGARIRSEAEEKIRAAEAEMRRRVEGMRLAAQPKVQEAPAPAQRAMPAPKAHAPAAADEVDLVSSEEEEQVQDGEEEHEEEEYEEEAEEGEEEEEEVLVEDYGGRMTLSQRERADWQRLMEPGAPPGEVLLQFAPNPATDIKVTREKLLCMRTSQWLNDEVINLYMLLLQERDTRLREQGGGSPRCHFFSSFFYNKLFQDEGRYKYDNVKRWTLPARLRNQLQASTDVLSVDRIIMPVHQGVHWTCAMVDLRAHSVSYYDSLMGEDHQVTANLLAWVRDEAKNKLQEDWDTSGWSVHFPKDIPRQRNGCDCGVFAIKFADYLGVDEEMTWGQKQMEFWRVKTTSQLMNLRVD